jgi:hypothetical protein
MYGYPSSDQDHLKLIIHRDEYMMPIRKIEKLHAEKLQVFISSVSQEKDQEDINGTRINLIPRTPKDV